MRPYLPELTIRDYNTYMRYLRAVRRQMSKSCLLYTSYVDCLCKEVVEIRAQAERAGLTLCSIYIGGGTPTSLSAAQLRQLMGTVRENFDLTKVVEYTAVSYTHLESQPKTRRFAEYYIPTTLKLLHTYNDCLLYTSRCV